MPKGVEPKVYPSYPGKKAGTNLHRINPSIGDDLGNAMHRAPRNTGGKNKGTALGMKEAGPGPSETRPRKRNRGAKPASRAMAGQPIMGKSGGALGGQTTGKIL